MTSMNDVDIENGKVQVELFNQTEAALAILREDYAEVPNFKTKTGYEEGKQALSKIVKYRTDLEKCRKRIKAPYLQAGQIIDAEAKRITAELTKLENPLALAKKEVDDHEKRMKEQRLQKLRTKIDDMRAWVDKARNQTSADVAEMIEVVDAINTQEDFYELTEEAVQAQADTLEKLGAIYSDRIQFEQAEQARKEAEEKQRAQEAANRINDRIQKLRMIPMDFMGKSAAEIRAKLQSLEGYAPPVTEFGDRLADAQDAQSTVIEQLQTMLTQAEQLEEAKAAESRRMDEQLQRDIQATTPGMTQEEAERKSGTGVESRERESADTKVEPETTHTTDASPSQLMDAMAEIPGAVSGDKKSGQADVFVHKEVSCGVIEHSDYEVLEYFFGDEGMSEMRYDDDEKEYELSVTVKRIAFK